MAGVQEEIAARAEVDGVRIAIVPDGPGDPAQAVDAVTREFQAQRERQMQTTSDDALSQGIVRRSKRKARLFNFSKQLDSDAYADLMQKMDLGLAIEKRKKDLTDGVKFALFIEWMELEQEIELVRAEVTHLGERFLDSIKAKREGAEAAKQKPRRVRRVQPVTPVEFDEMPPTHRGNA